MSTNLTGPNTVTFTDGTVQAAVTVTPGTPALTLPLGSLAMDATNGLLYVNGTTGWQALGSGQPPDPYLIINSGPPDNGFFGFPGTVTLARLPGVVAPAVTRYLPGTDGFPYQFVLSPHPDYGNVPLVLSPIGTGALQAQAADRTVVGGNARGTRAVDWQQERTAATHVASGDNAVIGGGRRNTASGPQATVGGGTGNTASSTDNAVGGGQSNTTTGFAATVAGGIGNTATGGYSTVAGGTSNTALGSYATVAGGYYGLADQYGMFSHASGRFSATGDAQYSRMVLRRQTTDATPLVLSADGSAPGASDRVALPAESAYCFDVYVIATQSAGVAGTASDSAWWHFRGGIRRDNANNTALIGSNVSETGADVGAAAWTVTVTADDVNEALQVEVTGEVDKTIRWVATVQYSRVTY